MGAAAAAANRSTLLRTAPISDTSEMNSRYGKVIRVNSTARSYFTGSSEKPGAKISMKDGMISSNTTSSDKLDHQQERQHLLREDPRLRPALPDQERREHRDEGGVERPFGEQRPEMVGQPERHEEGIGDRPRPQQCCGQDIPDKAENAAGQGQAADGKDLAEHGWNSLARRDRAPCNPWRPSRRKRHGLSGTPRHCR